jgi:hypothetical protein
MDLTNKYIFKFSKCFSINLFWKIKISIEKVLSRLYKIGFMTLLKENFLSLLN